MPHEMDSCAEGHLMPPRLPSRNMTLPQDVDDYLFSLQHGTVSRTVAEAVRDTEGYKAWKAMQEDE